jgi:hypothetical protein
MVKHIWTVLCRSTSVDSKTNNISLFDVFENLKISISLPKQKKTPLLKKANIPVDYQIVSLWTHDLKRQDKLKIKIVFKDPEGKELDIVTKDLILPADKKRMRDIIKVQGIVVGESGTYIFKIMVKEKGDKKFQSVAELPLEITIDNN